jgi:hypothetical protein
MSKISLLCAAVLLLTFQAAIGQDYSVEPIDAAPEAEGVSEEIAKLISDQGYRVKKGSKRIVCEIWLCKDLAIDPEFKPSEERLYPFSPGQLMGVLHFSRRGSEFRDQTISKGWYTLRFGLQPVDGNHEGTSPTRDFLLLVDPSEDELPEPWDAEDLHKASANAAGSSHPAMLCLQRPGEGSEVAIQHDESNDWWVLHVVAAGVADEKAQEIPMDLVVVGHAAE